MRLKIDKRTVLQRLNRRLAQRQWVVRRTRGRLARVHPYVLLDLERNVVLAFLPDLDMLARDSGALKPYEQIAA